MGKMALNQRMSKKYESLNLKSEIIQTTTSAREIFAGTGASSRPVNDSCGAPLPVSTDSTDLGVGEMLSAEKGHFINENSMNIYKKKENQKKIIEEIAMSKINQIAKLKNLRVKAICHK